MNHLSRSACRSLALLILSTAASPRLLFGTGYEEPTRWLVSWDKPVALAAPEFFFELEMKRLAAELQPGIKAVAPPVNEQFDVDYAKQTATADLADFQDALQTKRIAPPDAEAARAAHEARRNNMGAEDGAPLPAEFPSEFADYHEGAAGYKEGEPDKARAAWTRLLDRPAAERHYRTVWAAYMLGRIAIDAKDWEEATAAFGRAREAVIDGFADTPGLASASLGWEAFAHLEQRNFSTAARLYLEQLATGDLGAVHSLKAVLISIFGEDADLTKLAHDPVLQRLATAGVVAEIGPFAGELYSPETEDNLGKKWLKAIEAVDVKQVRDADRLAWAAYARGSFDTARRWLTRSDAANPYTLWLRAKFALREGNVPVAAKLLGEAVRKVPPIKELETRPINAYNTLADAALKADFGLTRLHRGEFTSALQLFLDAGRIKDAFYVADAVLTIEELKKFIEQGYPLKPQALEAPKATEEPNLAESEGLGVDPTSWYDLAERPGVALREMLGRRLVRLERLAEARPYFAGEAGKHLEEYTALLVRAKDAKQAKALRAAAFWEAAQLMREYGNFLADYYDPVTMANRTTRRRIGASESSDYALEQGEPDPTLIALSGAEQERVKKHSRPRLRRYYSQYLAADLAWRGAALMPDNEEQTAVVLNTAGSWLKIGDTDAADRFYQAIERRCSKTTLGREAIKRHWFVPIARAEEEAEASNEPQEDAEKTATESTQPTSSIQSEKAE
ncbi:MAG TPA: hypothetical protein VF614_10955 [Chthoniobacteraceae bacterium]